MDQRNTTQVVRMLTPDERKEMLESINSPADLRKLPVEELPVLARALRDFMVESVSKTGGHLSSSLGATELAIALHYVFNTPEDAIVWDVGHQAYAHKILTGRRDAMATLRQTDGISGFRSAAKARTTPSVRRIPRRQFLPHSVWLLLTASMARKTAGTSQ